MLLLNMTVNSYVNLAYIIPECWKKYADGIGRKCEVSFKEVLGKARVFVFPCDWIIYKLLDDGGLVALVKDIQAKVERFEEKRDSRENPEIKDILEKQKHLDKAIAENAAAIRNIDNHIETALKM